MGIMDKIRGSTPSERSAEKSTYEIAYEAEKKKIKEEMIASKQSRADERLKRAATKAAQDARNPMYKRIAKKVGASGKAAIGAVAADIGKRKAQSDYEKDMIGKARRTARMTEMSKIAAHQEREKVRAKMQPGKSSQPDFFGDSRNDGMLDIPKMDLNIGGSKKKKSKMNFLDGF